MNYPDLKRREKSEKRGGAAENDHSEKRARCKLLVKNVPFAASAAEMRELFGTFGQLRALRMPKKFSGGHRGYAFVDYVLPHEAEEAKLHLASTHLYGRHLVCSWAASDGDGE